MEDIRGMDWEDFKPVASTDGSYGGTKKHVEATEKHYNMKLEQELLKVNKRLKSSKTKVAIEIAKGGIQLRATLPLKPGDTHKQGRNKKQYKISLGIPASFDGLKTAQEEAYELGKLIARQTFTWTDKYLGNAANKDKGITFEEFYEQFEERYFEKRKKTIKSEGTFNKYKIAYKSKFLDNQLINKETIRKKIVAIEKPEARNEAIRIASIFCKELEIDINFKDLILKSNRRERNIPSDKDIVEGFLKFQHFLDSTGAKNKHILNCGYRITLVYGLLATYGLRPREAINQPDLDWLISPENKYNTFKVHDSNKTGYREVFPFVPEWVEFFGIKKRKNVEKLKEFIANINGYKLLANKVRSIDCAFSRYSFGFTPYDLRHACAIRAHLQGMPIKAAADNLGHSVEIHTKVYQQWFGLENRRKAFEQTFEGVNELEKVKDELAQARKRIAELELEVTRLRLNQSNPL